MNTQATIQTPDLLRHTVLWDNHACMPLRPGDDSFLPQLSRHRASGVSVVSLNVYFDLHPPELVFQMLASFRHWLCAHSDEYVLAETVADIESAKRPGKLAVFFDIEGGRAVESHPGLVEVLYRLGVRWMLLAYNKNTRLGGGCQDDDSGLTVARNPVIFSHSNPRALKDHDRNIPDDLMLACARTGGVVNINGIGIFLGDNDNSTDTLIRHIGYAVELIGAEHVGLGLDYVFDRHELDEHVRGRPDIFPPARGYRASMSMVEPERFPEIAEALLKSGLREHEVQGILGQNNLRVASR